MSIHQVIREGRRRLGMSEQQFAESLGVSRGAVQHWEKPDGTAPQRKTQPRVAKLLGITVAELLTGATSMTNGVSAKTAVPVFADLQAAPVKSGGLGAKRPAELIHVNVEVGKHTYAVRLGGRALFTEQDFFGNATVLVIEPDLEPISGDYVVVLDPGAKVPTVKQLVGAGRNLYLRPLDRQIPASLKGSQPVLGVVREAIRSFR